MQNVKLEAASLCAPERLAVVRRRRWNAPLLVGPWCRGRAGQVQLSGVGRRGGVDVMARARLVPAALVVEFRLDGVDCIVCGRRAIALIPKHGIRHDDSCCRLPPTPPPATTRGPSRRAQRSQRQLKKAGPGAPRRVLAGNSGVFPSGRGRI